MKKLSYILGIIGLAIILIASIFKVSHFPGAGILFTLGISFLSFIFLPIAYVQLLRTTTDNLLKWVYHAAFISFFVDFIGMLFKVMHWPGANKLLMIAIPLPFILFLPVYIIYHNNRKLKTDNHFFGIILFMIYLGVFSALLALSYSKDFLYSYASSAETISIGTKSMSNQLTKESKAIELVNMLEQIKIDLAIQIDDNNVHYIDNNKLINVKDVTSKDKKMGYTTYSSIGFREFDVAYEIFKTELLDDSAIDITKRLFTEIDIYRIPKHESDYPVIGQLTLINTLNILSDWQNKILLIEYLSEHES